MKKTMKLDQRNIEDVFSLTPVQEGMLFYYLKSPDNSRYHEQFTLEIYGKINHRLFEEAWNFVIAGNEMLRTVFRWENIDKPVQIVMKEHILQPAYHDLSSYTDNDRQKHLDGIKSKRKSTPFNLHEIPFKLALLKLSQSQHGIIIDSHHIIYDGWSNGIILKEFFNAYNELAKGKNIQIPVKTKFKEFVKWNRNLEQPGEIKNQEQFWKDYLQGYDTQTNLSVKRTIKKEITQKDSYRTRLDRGIITAMETLKKEQKLTLATLFYCAWGLLLQKYNNNSDVIFGTTVSGRTAKIQGIEHIVGLFINTLPLRLQTNDNERIAELLNRLEHVLQLREQFESTPLVRINQCSRLSNRGELFNSIVVIENYPLDNRLPESTDAIVPGSFSMDEMTHYDITLSVTLFDAIELNIIYNKDIFERSDMERINRHFISIIKEILTHPGKEIRQIDILNEQEKKQLLNDFNDNMAEYPKTKTLHELFADQVSKTPHNTALVLNNRSLTYIECDRISDILAWKLRKKNIPPGSIAAIMADRSIEMVTGIMGILKAGCSYLPILPNYPVQRIKYILRDSTASVMFTTKPLWENTPLELDIPFLDLEDISSAKIKHVALPQPLSTPNDLAYVIYTSGSTGKPKGVLIEHHSVVNILCALQEKYPLLDTDAYLFKTSYVFDVSVTELFGWFLAGGRLVILENDGEKDPGKIAALIAREGITHINFVPSMFNVFIEQLSPDVIGQFSGLRYVFLAGEELKPQLVKKFKRLDTPIILENIYGPTEAAIYACGYSCNNWKNRETVPIGKPLPNLSLYILDKHEKLQPVNAPGELCISGKGLSRGYLNNPEQTAEKFITGLYQDNHERLYRTGDFAYWGADGLMEFLGRIDFQVKIRGFRIELGEVENSLLHYPGVKETAVVARENQQGENLLLAYLVAETKLDMADLRKFLLKDIPGYMVPSYFMQIDSMPVTLAGKIDRMALPQYQWDTGADFIAPAGDLEKTLAKIWGETLDLEYEKIDRNCNFFLSGGHSLKVNFLLSRIHKTFNVKLPVTAIFDSPTLRDLAEQIKAEKKEEYTGIQPAAKKEHYPLALAQKRLYILHQMEEDTRNYNSPEMFLLEGDLDRKKLEEVFQKIIQRHESFRTSFVLIGDEPCQLIHPEADFSVEYHESALEEVSKLAKEFIRPFNLACAPLLRVSLVKVEAGKHVVMVDMHHIITDGISQEIFIDNVVSLYKGDPLKPLRLQYKDYSEWLISGEQQKELYQKQGAYWRNVFQGEIPILELPTDFERPEVQSFEGNRVTFSVPTREALALKKLALKEEATLFIVLASLYFVFLSRLSGQEDIVVGTPVAGRNHADLDSIIGMFVNTLAIRNSPDGDKTFAQFLGEVKRNTLDAFENQNYPFEELVEKVVEIRDLSRNPLFDAMLVLQNMEHTSIELPDLEIKPFHFSERTARFDLTFLAVEDKEQLVFTTEYCIKLFKLETIHRFITYFKELVTSVTADPGQKIGLINILPEKEKNTLLYQFNSQDVKYADDKPLQQLFEEQVERNPDAISLDFTSSGFRSLQVSYRQLNQKANRLAHLLKSKGVKPGVSVAVLMVRSLEMVVGILGILKAGGAYLPIDSSYPASRIYSILSESGVSLVLADEKAIEKTAVTSLKHSSAIPVTPHITKPCSHIKDFDRLPKPDRSLVDYSKYHRYIGIAMARHTISIQATRGCPYNCAYCHKIWSKSHVPRSAENIFDEIRTCYDAGIKRFVFIDDIFNLENQNSARLLQTIIDERLKIQLFFPNGLRGDILTKEFIDLMVAAGTINIDLALETAAPRLQKLIGKNLNLKRFKENVHYIIETYPHIILEMEMMIGFPTETEEEALQTLEFLKELKWLHFPNLNILKIYPNTDMYRLAIENGVSPEAIAASSNLAYHELPETLPFSKSFVRKLQTYLMKDYFLSKERLLHVLPQQMKYMIEDELVQKYNSYLPNDIKSFDDILQFAGISHRFPKDVELLKDENAAAPMFGEKISAAVPKKEPEPGALRVLFIDLSQLFSHQSSGRLYDMVEAPLGLMYLLTYLQEKFGRKIYGKIIKSRIDFDNYNELKYLVDDMKPHLIGIRTLSNYKEFFHKTLSLLKLWAPEVPIIAGGPYATSDYKSMLQDTAVDLAVIGEGEYTTARLIERIMAHKGKMPPEKERKEIPGLAFLTSRDKELLREKNRQIIIPGHITDVLQGFPSGNPENQTRPGDLLYLISTSGSTGKPKSIMLEHRNMANLLNVQFSRMDVDFSGSVLQFTSIGFDVSAQEIFSTLLSGGTLCLIDENLRSNVSGLFKLIGEKEISVLFLPPAFLKSIFLDRQLASEFPPRVKHIIAAGEQLVVNERFKQYLKENQVYLHNHYGPAETHVVTTLAIDPAGDIPAKPSIGKPIANVRLYILDKNCNLQPIGVRGELYIAGRNVGRGYYGKPELTEERFISGAFLGEERLYRTGDMCRWLQDGNIQFLGRSDSQIKIRGFRIETGEIETHIVEHHNVKNCVVLARTDDRGDGYLTAYVVPTGSFEENELDEDRLKDYLSKTLPDYMVTTRIIFLPEIPLTPNGKIAWKELPEPGKGDSDEPYIAPRDEIEKRVAAVFAEVLGADKVSIFGNFFDLGGHSLKATILLAKLHRLFNARITLADLFRDPNVSGMAGILRNAEQERFEVILPAQEKTYYQLSSAQKRLYFLQQMDENSTVYNMPSFVELEGNLEKDRFEATFAKLIKRHESLRTCFRLVDDTPYQQICEEMEFVMDYHETDLAGARQLASEFVQPFNLGETPLIRGTLVKLEDNRHLLMQDMHHIIYDAMSHSIYMNEFMKLYKGEQLPRMTLQYKDFSQWQNSPQQQKNIERQEAYWMDIYKGDTPVLNLPVDFPRPLNYTFEGLRYKTVIDEVLTQKTAEFIQQQGVTLNIVLLAVYYVLLVHSTGQEEIVVGIPVSGRRHTQLHQLIGFFANMLPLKNKPRGEKDFLSFLAEVKESFFSGYENQDFPFDELVWKLGVERDSGRHPLVETVFVAVAKDTHIRTGGTGEMHIGDLIIRPFESEEKISHFDLMFHITEVGKVMNLLIEYRSLLFKPSTIRQLAAHYIQALEQVLENPTVRLEEVVLSHDLKGTRAEVYKDEDDDWLN